MSVMTKTYKQLQTELDEVLEKIQAEELNVEEAIKLYEQGEKLIRELETYLKTAENKIKKLKLPKT
jgi:exodeoxyribonuclease VII small subunit